ncbi:MAG: hypothetical protein NTY88_03360 [Bacteroidetes bacterium]|nr:hypothetical protein [Bacteroidota bacterium]
METGHAKNVANFQILINSCNGYGAAYNPAKNRIKIANLTTVHQGGVNALQLVDSKLPALDAAIADRQEAYGGLSKFYTRIGAAVDASDLTAGLKKDAHAIIKKIVGQRATPKPPKADSENDKTHSASQMSYDQRQENFQKLYELLNGSTGYSPNETDLKVAALQADLQILTDTNTIAKTNYTPVANARIARDKVLYAPEEGLYDLQNEVKKYVKSVFGATSAEFKQISGLKFTKPGKK